MANAGTIILVLFGGVFFLVGITLFVTALNDIGLAEDNSPWVLAAMGAVFAAVGGGIIWIGLHARTSMRRQEELQQQHPKEPWLWEERWRDRRIKHDARGASLALWGFAILWNAIVGTAIAAGWRDLLDQVSEEPGMLFFLLFPVVGIGVLIAAIRSTMQWRRFGTSTLVLDRLPVPIGGELEGVLELPADVREADEVLVTLVCLRTTRHGKNTTTTMLWGDERRHPRSSMGSGSSGPTLAIRFSVPPDAVPSSVGGGTPSISWKVRVTAAVSGVDFAAEYPIPVFQTDDPPTTTRAAEDAPKPDRTHQRGAGVIQRTIVRAPLPEGGAEWVYPAFRAKGGAAFMFLFTLFWTGIVYLLVTQDVPGIFAAIFGFFEVVLVLGLIDVLFGRLIVRIDRQGLVATSGPGILWKTRRLPLNGVTTFEVKLGMTVGSTAYHSIEARTDGGQKLAVGKYLRSRGEAEAIVEEMEAELKRVARG